MIQCLVLERIRYKLTAKMLISSYMPTIPTSALSCKTVSKGTVNLDDKLIDTGYI